MRGLSLFCGLGIPVPRLQVSYCPTLFFCNHPKWGSRNKFQEMEKKYQSKIKLLKLRNVIYGFFKQFTRRQKFIMVLWVILNLVILDFSSVKEFGKTDITGYSKSPMMSFNGSDNDLYPDYENPNELFWPVGTRNIAYYDDLEFIIIGLMPVIIFMVWVKLGKENNESN